MSAAAQRQDCGGSAYSRSSACLSNPLLQSLANCADLKMVVETKTGVSKAQGSGQVRRSPKALGGSTGVTQTFGPPGVQGTRRRHGPVPADHLPTLFFGLCIFHRPMWRVSQSSNLFSPQTFKNTGPQTESPTILLGFWLQSTAVHSSHRKRIVYRVPLSCLPVI